MMLSDGDEIIIHKKILKFLVISSWWFVGSVAELGSLQ